MGSSCCPVVLEILKGSERRGVRKEGNIRLWSGTMVMDFVLFFNLATTIFPFPPTSAKLIGDDPTLSNLAFVPILLVLITRFH